VSITHEDDMRERQAQQLAGEALWDRMERRLADLEATIERIMKQGKLTAPNHPAPPLPPPRVRQPKSAGGPSIDDIIRGLEQNAAKKAKRELQNAIEDLLAGYSKRHGRLVRSAEFSNTSLWALGGAPKRKVCQYVVTISDEPGEERA
jgi:hypothetical protein